MLTQADLLAAKERRAGNPVIRMTADDPELPDDITAMLVMTGLHARWCQNFWRVFLPDSANITNSVGGGKLRRWQTGVRAEASPAEWLAEINRFWKDVHPGEPLPFGEG
ncbi:MAG TPA: hypothetical protein VN734_17200 [Acidobacteriaceae bacterium]|nr:hypothetical protein [Acidobacteriaceae bacterium]